MVLGALSERPGAAALFHGLKRPDLETGHVVLWGVWCEAVGRRLPSDGGPAGARACSSHREACGDRLELSTIFASSR